MLAEVEGHFGTKDFVSVHVRAEADWEENCRGSQNRSDEASSLFNNKYQCWVSARDQLHHLPPLPAPRYPFLPIFITFTLDLS